MLTQHTPSLLTTIEKPHVDLEDQEGLRKPNQQIPYTHRSPLHLLTPISSHFCLLSFLSYVLSFFLPFLLSPLISYCSNLWNVHRPVVSMKFWFLKGTLLSFFSALSDMSRGRKGLHGRSDKSHLLTKRQEEEERKRENLETIFDSDSPTVYTTKERYGLSDLVKGKAGVRADQILCVWECSCACQKEIKRTEDIYFSCLVACTW